MLLEALIAIGDVAVRPAEVNVRACLALGIGRGFRAVETGHCVGIRLAALIVAKRPLMRGRRRHANARQGCGSDAGDKALHVAELRSSWGFPLWAVVRHVEAVDHVRS